MKGNKNVIIEVLSNELVYERKEHKSTLYDLRIEQECLQVANARIERVERENQELEKCIAEFCNKPSAEEIATVGIQLRERNGYLEELLFEFGDDLQEREGLIFELGDDIEEREALIFELGDDLKKLEEENKLLKIEQAAFKRAIETMKKEAHEAKQCDCKNAGIKSEQEKKPEKNREKKEEPEPAPAEAPACEANSSGKKDILISIKNKLCNKNYKVQQTEKTLIANKPGTRRIEVQHAELPGSVKYIVCGQIYYEFDKAIKASAHGVKYTEKLNEEDLDGKTEERGGAA